MMKHRLAATAAALVSLAIAADANATIVGSTYSFSASTSGNTAISATNGTYTDPANAGFCVGPPTACGFGSGMSGSYAFAQSTPTLDTITFNFAGSTAGAGPGTFTIDLGNFVTTDGESITGVTYSSGNLQLGDFSNVSWNGTDAVFTGSTPDDYSAIGGVSVVFDVTTTKAPEPASLALLGAGLAGMGVIRRRRAV